MSIAYWNKHGNNFLINKETFDKEMIEFLKNVEDIHSRIESPYNIVVQTPSMRVEHRHKFHTFSKKNIIYFQSLAYSILDDIRDDIGNTSMRIHILQKPNIPKPVVSVKPKIDKDTKEILDEMQLKIIRYIGTIFQNNNI
jgi:hypothetical protein